MHARPASILAAFCLTAFGCHSEEPFVPVEGRVTLEGQVLAPGAVSFRPDPARGNTSLHHPAGELDDEGRYRLTTAGRPGAPAGWYKVLVFASEKVGEGRYGGPADPKWRMSQKYLGEATTPLSVEVAESPVAGAYDFDLAR